MQHDTRTQEHKKNREGEANGGDQLCWFAIP